MRDMPTIYQVPLLLSDQGLIPSLRSKLNLDAITVPPALATSGKELFETWKELTTRSPEDTVEIALVGKYVQHHDAYMSVEKSLEHSSMRLGRKLNLHWVDSEHLEAAAQAKDPEAHEEAWNRLRAVSGISEKCPSDNGI